MKKKQQTMTLQSLKAELSRLLRLAANQTGLEIDVPYETGEIMRLCADYDRAAVLLHGDDAVCDLDVACMTAIAEKRADGVPLGYLIGQSPFCGHDFFVCDENSKTLIPRADTELLVEQLCSVLQPGDRFLDLCCGGGCIALSALCATSETAADGVEKDPGALSIAMKNTEKFGLSERFYPYAGDVLAGDCPGSGYHCIVSNPPYIPTSDLRTLDSQVQCEPHMALDGGEDGMDFYRAILTQYVQYLLPDGVFLFEIGYDEGIAISRLGEQHGFYVTLTRDFGGNDRVAVLKRR